MLERLHGSDEDLVGRTVLLVDDDARNIFALSSVLERRGMRVLTATTGNEAIGILQSTPEVAIALMDIMMPEMDGYQTMQEIRKDDEAAASADHRPDRQGHERRSRKMRGCGRLRLSGETGQYRAVAGRTAECGCTAKRPSYTMRQQRDRQHPDGRRSAGQAAELRGDPAGARREPDQGQLRARGARAPAQARGRRRADRRQHAGARRLRAGEDAARAPPLREDRHHLRFRHPPFRRRPHPRL